ncbi:hypothetical protein A3A09_01285 [Candidatus Nomurabacteria bacterium RIFCSPLOWO2_01_FULL_42_20]|uniref:glutamate--cysteine ligase n=1 Tax=Candidatus Nomurabacteria bacterium RIFCSPHIGHO2_01_FULL_42_16 TaxID=1801743 RepID=A0A1F6VHU6_9BACT|nr:MAG: hypothetical protein A2824_01660 [Candidatus Nomurabacteria bacterium RIFCSPHIGHO2_01_FULL_42_16]OGI92372.1 MAG: hypothetical protein A3A09_01285 [Candidatus Nomurabacteria bacterium RIFCSPLOWO2_01_FULL_42_20]
MDQLFSKVINSFKRGFVNRMVGIEIEYPVVSTTKETFGQAASVQKIFPALIDSGWEPLEDNFYHQVVDVAKNGVSVTTDASGGILEIILPPLKTLFEADQLLKSVLAEIAGCFQKEQAVILGYGIHPKEERLQWVSKRRYDFLRKALPPSLESITISASSQVHLDITAEEFIPAINVFNAFGGVFFSLLSNSPVGASGVLPNKAHRETFYEAFAPGRSGIFPRPIEGHEDYLKLMTDLPMLVAENENKLDYFLPSGSFKNFTKTRSKEIWLKDYQLHEGVVWWNARPRSAYGTIEIRHACAQPHPHQMTVAALSLGIMENLKIAVSIQKSLDWSVWECFRKAAIKYGINLLGKDARAREIVAEVLKIAKDGLIKRGFNEEVYIEPLEESFRVERDGATCALEAFDRGGHAGLIAQTAWCNK